MTRWTVRVVVVAVAAVVVIVIATAGSGADSSGDPEATIAGPDPEQMAAFRDCLNEHGARSPEVPNGPGTPPAPSGSTHTPPAGGVTLPAPGPRTRRALEACSELMPTPPAGAPPGAPIPQD